MRKYILRIGKLIITLIFMKKKVTLGLLNNYNKTNLEKERGEINMVKYGQKNGILAGMETVKVIVK